MTWLNSKWKDAGNCDLVRAHGSLYEVTDVDPPYVTIENLNGPRRGRPGLDKSVERMPAEDRPEIASVLQALNDAGLGATVVRENLYQETRWLGRKGRDDN